MQKHALMIGGTRGLGKAVVDLFAKEKHKLSVLARNKPVNDNRSINTDYFEGDLCNEIQCTESLKNIIQTNGNLNYLIFLQRFRGDGDSWQGELEVTLHATRMIIEIVKNNFHQQQDCSIVMVSSMAGKFATNSQPLGYSVAKAGLNQMVQNYAVELGQRGIRVNAVSPCSFVKEESRQFYQNNKDLHNLYKKIIPLGRMCQTEDIANVISFLCSDKAAFMTGQNLIVDGGLSVINHESLARTVVTN